MKKKMAYLMHVDWNWIKQRPHFLAEKLSAYYELDLFFIRNQGVKGLVNNSTFDGFNSINILYKFPFSSQIHIFENIEKKINNSVQKILYSNYYDYIWITSPIILQFINLSKIRYGYLIYDCMDDVSEFPQSKKAKSYLLELERRVLAKNNIVFASSERLQETIQNRGYKEKVYLINNALEPEKLNLKRKENGTKVKKTINLFNLGYFGTISEWFDFKLISSLLKLRNDITFTLIGPTNINIPKHSRINYVGPVIHEKLVDNLENIDAFIMPFVVNSLVLSVDPVKVYEYIAFGKPSFVVKYPETEKFKDLVYLYENVEDLSQKINDVINGNNHIEKSKVDEFINNNTWDNRVDKIRSIITSYFQ